MNDTTERSKSETGMRAVRVALVVALLAWVGSGTAQADDPDGNWWYQALGVPQAQAEGITGKGVAVAVIGRGISPDLPVLADAHLRVHEPSMCPDPNDSDYLDGKPFSATSPNNTQLTWYATNLIALIVGNGDHPSGRESISGVAPEADVRFYATDNAESEISPAYYCDDVDGAIARAIVQAVDDKARVILVVEAVSSEPNPEIAEAVAYAVHEDVILVVPTDPSTAWMSGLNGVVGVWYSDSNGPGRKEGAEQYGRTVVTVLGSQIMVEGRYLPLGGPWEETSLQGGDLYAAALAAGVLADVAQKWPRATNNQLIQTLIRNTGQDDHDLVYYDDQAGYGQADLLHMLRVDPTGYEDTNPLVVADDGQDLGLTEQNIRHASRPAWADDPASTPTPEPTQSLDVNDFGAPGLLWAVLGLVAAVTVGLIYYLVRRRGLPLSR